MSDQISLQPVSNYPDLAIEPLRWSLQLWGEGKEEFSSQDWHDFYANALNANYQSWNLDGFDQELLYLAIRDNKGSTEVVASIALCDFDDLQEFRHLKPWIAAFIVREDLRGSGIGGVVLKLMEEKVVSFGINTIYLWTESAVKFYSNRGYKVIDKLIKPGREIVIMSKNIST